MLGLKATTNDAWAPLAVQRIDDILRDHGHCEKKASLLALTLIQRYPEREELVRKMIEIAREELEHLELVLNILSSRKLSLGRDKGSKYAQELHTHVRREEPQRLLDFLMIGALIEARSCERFSLLAQHINDEELREFYRSLLASEAGHYKAYTDLARTYFPLAEVKSRLNEFCEIEADIIRNLKNGPSMHG